MKNVKSQINEIVEILKGDIDVMKLDHSISYLILDKFNAKKVLEDNIDKLESNDYQDDEIAEFVSEETIEFLGEFYLVLLLIGSYKIIKESSTNDVQGTFDAKLISWEFKILDNTSELEDKEVIEIMKRK